MRAGAVTFVTPHQGPTSGGVHVIEQLARRLARTRHVTLVVLGGPTRPLPGVEVVGVRRSLRRRVPRADLLVLPGDSPRVADFLALGERVGRPLLLVQSWGHPNGEHTAANVALVGDGVALSQYLADHAARAGCTARLWRPGLDRRTFFPGRRTRSSRRIAMLCHHDPWKGQADGAAAWRLVHRRAPDAELHLFGRSETTVAGAIHHGALTRAGVARLLRTSDVFVCASHEEGLGLPGLEALSCGAALATTDTGGSRDYAIDGETALVSAPGDAPVLAEHVATLLDDPPLRARLVDAGRRLTAQRYPSWAVAAQRFERVLHAL